MVYGPSKLKIKAKWIEEKRGYSRCDAAELNAHLDVKDKIIIKI